MKPTFHWHTWVWSLAILGALLLIILGDRQQAAWVSRLSRQGGAAPALDAHSPTGYALGQRQFLGTHERGGTYRWIARTQEAITLGAFASRTYRADTVPVGRPELAPRLYTWWLASISWADHVITGDSNGVAAERVAVWEPRLVHVLAAIGVVLFIWRRFGAAASAATGLFFALFPLIGGQFLPGVLTPRTWALLLATYALSLHLNFGDATQTEGFGFGAALTAALALWLDPAVGFAAVFISALAGGAAIDVRATPVPFLRWSVIGAVITALAWFLDGATWSPAAGELRYVHPLYAITWLGFGLALDGWQRLRSSPRVRGRARLEIAFAVALIAALPYTQIKFGFKGWLYPSAAMERLTSLDETTVYHGIVDWFARASSGERLFLLAPGFAAAVVLAIAFLRAGTTRRSLLRSAIVIVAVIALACCRVRWAVVLALLAPPLVCRTASGVSAATRRWAFGIAALFVLGLAAWDRALPAPLRVPSNATDPSATDIDALVYRHFAHWLASHNPGQKINALAPPDLSDALVFHGGAHVLMSTAWESYPGQVAASRFLSAPESTEAEAILQSRDITHVILPSWDKVLPLLVHEPQEDDKSTLYSRLQRWVFPPYLRPIPYHLPPIPGYADQKLVVFKVVPPQDEALSLARLAEYFVEMNRDEPATLVAKVLVESYPDDPNAALARATVFQHVGNQVALAREVERLAANVSAGRIPSSWDRRVQRAIVLALGQRPDLERSEVAACVAACSNESLFTLTPLQAYRLVILAKRNGVSFPSESLARLAESLGAEYTESARHSAPN